MQLSRIRTSSAKHDIVDMSATERTRRQKKLMSTGDNVVHESVQLFTNVEVLETPEFNYDLLMIPSQIIML